MTAQDRYAHWIDGEPDTTWMAQAACAGKHDLWFTPATNMQKLVCSSCPVRDNCLEYAIEMGEEQWVYGGFTPEERRRLGPPMENRYCRECQEWMRVPKTSNRLYCSSQCRNRAWMRQHRKAG